MVDIMEQNAKTIEMRDLGLAMSLAIELSELTNGNFGIIPISESGKQKLYHIISNHKNDCEGNINHYKIITSEPREIRPILLLLNREIQAIRSSLPEKRAQP